MLHVCGGVATARSAARVTALRWLASNASRAPRSRRVLRLLVVCSLRLLVARFWARRLRLHEWRQSVAYLARLLGARLAGCVQPARPLVRLAAWIFHPITRLLRLCYFPKTYLITSIRPPLLLRTAAGGSLGFQRRGLAGLVFGVCQTLSRPLCFRTGLPFALTIGGTRTARANTSITVASAPSPAIASPQC